MICGLVAACIFLGVKLSGAASGDGTEGDQPLVTEAETQVSETCERSETEGSSNTDVESEQSQSEALEVTETERQTEEVPSGGVPTERVTDVSSLELGEGYVVNYTSKPLDVDGLLDRGFIFSAPVGSKAPVVMVIHTHTSEQYASQADTDRYKLNSVVAAGERIAAVLNARGLAALHCTVIHDGDGGNAYLNARDTIKMMLEIYPTVKYVIDVHRMVLTDSEGNEMRTMTTSDGAAQIRLTVSADIKREGAWQDDASLALELRGELNDDGQRVCAPVVVSHGGYNGDLCRFFIMADIGSSQNTVTEAMLAANKFAMAFADVVNAER